MKIGTKALLTILQKHIAGGETKEHAVIEFSKEQLDILNKEKEMHLQGKSKSFSREEAKEIIRKLWNKKYN